jgi:hypothetical protein
MRKRVVHFLKAKPTVTGHFFFAGYMQDKKKRQNGNHKKIHKDAENSVCGYADGREIIE